MGGPETDEWHIDDLAHRSGTTVDTIRFYQRDGLLPPAQRRGRSLVYGPEHLERLECIRDLQARHFSLKAIKALAAEGRLQLLNAMFVSDERSFTRAELVTQSGLDEAIVGQLEAVGMLASPELRGAIAYDGHDLVALTTLALSLARGMPEAVGVEIARLYNGLMEKLRGQLWEIFSVGGVGLAPALSDEDLDAFRTLAANDIDRFMADAGSLLEYMHRRALQRMVVEAMELVDANEAGSSEAGSNETQPDEARVN